MAAEKKNPPVNAPIFKQSVNISNYEVDEINEKKFARIFPKQLMFSRLTPNANPKLFNPASTETGGQIMRPARMLIYEDSSEEDDGFRSTPPNIQERKIGTPGAPTKSRKDIEKKVLRPKKLVYNDNKGNYDNRSEDIDKDNQLYQMTPKKSGNEDQDNADFYYDKFLNITATIIPRKIIPVAEDESRSVHLSNRQFGVVAAGSSRDTVWQEDNSNKQSRMDESRKKNGARGSRKSSKLTIPKNDLDCDKENNAVHQSRRERDREETGGTSFGSSKNRATTKKELRKIEEFTCLSKTRFRI